MLHYYGEAGHRNFPKRKVEPASIAQLRSKCLERRRQERGVQGLRTSRYAGVQSTSAGKWVAVIPSERGYLRDGTWSDERRAAIARDRAVLTFRACGCGVELAPEGGAPCDQPSTVKHRAPAASPPARV